MENPEGILQSLEEFSKIKPRDIPQELEEYLKFVAKSGDPVYQWTTIKTLFREKLVQVIKEFSESCPSMEIPPCPNVELFNFDLSTNFILEKLDTFSSAPFTLQRLCELLTTPRKEYNRIDKYMRAIEKNILVVSTTEPGGKSRNGEGVMNGVDDHNEYVNDINVEEMDESPSWRGSSLNIEEKHTKKPLENINISQTPEDKEITHTLVPSTSEESLKIEASSSKEPEPQIPVEYMKGNIDELADNGSCVKSNDSSEINIEEAVDPLEPTEKDLASDIPPIDQIDPVASTSAIPNICIIDVKEEDRIKLTSSDNGIENISPESSTSSPETLQADFEPTVPANEPETNPAVTESKTEEPSSTPVETDTNVSQNITEKVVENVTENVQVMQEKVTEPEIQKYETLTPEILTDKHEVLTEKPKSLIDTPEILTEKTEILTEKPDTLIEETKGEDPQIETDISESDKEKQIEVNEEPQKAEEKLMEVVEISKPEKAEEKLMEVVEISKNVSVETPAEVATPLETPEIPSNVLIPEETPMEVDVTEKVETTVTMEESDKSQESGESLESAESLESDKPVESGKLAESGSQESDK